MADRFEPRPEHKFTFGLWTVGNPGADPFGAGVRPELSPADLVYLLADVGAYGVNLHDNDLVPFGASEAEHDRIVGEFKDALEETGLEVPMASTNLFYHPIFKDGAFTANDPEVRAFALQKSMEGLDLGAELGVHTYVFWGGREGTESDATKDPVDALERMREAINFLADYVKDRGYDMQFALEAKPNEPRGNLYLPTTAAMLAFIETLDDPEMMGVNPEVAHEHMVGLNFLHAVAQAWDAGKLIHIDLNDQNFSRYDQDFRFASQNYKKNFFLVKFLEDVGYDGPRHFDAHAYRTEDVEGVKEFARGCMRSYLVLQEKAREMNEDAEIQALVDEVHQGPDAVEQLLGPYDADRAKALRNHEFDVDAIAERGLRYEKIDQLVFDLMHGVR